MAWLAGATVRNPDFAAVEARLGGLLPADYRQFMALSNGGEGPLGENHLSFWKIEDVIEKNAEYQTQQYLPMSGRQRFETTEASISASILRGTPNNRE